MNWLATSKPGQDVEVEVLPGAYHNSNLAPERQLLWDNLAHWARTVPRPPALTR